MSASVHSLPTQYVQRLAQRIHADAVWWGTCGVIEGTVHVLDLDMCSTHTTVSCEPIEAFRGAELGTGSFVDRGEDVLALRRGRWSLSAPSSVHTNKFALWDEEFVKPYNDLREQRVFRERRWVHSFYEMYEAYDQLRGFFFNPINQSVGVVCFWRCGTGKRFSEQEQQLLNAELSLPQMLFCDSITQTLDATEHLIMDPGGDVTWSSPALDKWLTRDRVRGVFDGVREGHRRVSLHGCLIELIELLDDQTLCKVTPATPVVMAPWAKNSAQQRDVASLLASGATNQEIAALLSISLGAVRSSIRALCKSSGASSRLELIAIMRGTTH